MKVVREWKELKEPINFASTTITLTTIVIDFKRCPSFKDRLAAVLHAIIEPYRLNRDLSREYKLWIRRSLLNSSRRRMRWLADHRLFWVFYCVIALVKGYAEGATWTWSE